MPCLVVVGPGSIREKHAHALLLDQLDDDTAFVGLGFTIDPTAQKGAHIVLGCSHIYSTRGEGLQYRLSKVEKPILSEAIPTRFCRSKMPEEREKQYGPYSMSHG